ncbi:aladin [Andrographis paniculata]|uniref:aladin n=1 Tax=Andrographis paniculata TaxID=175694 RepID=UPI0021E95773|nr:aladin [Andrographis paniculata]XP_051141530.1 aladin [Andrographis paniculata]XP_051141540.1 aladin [Andrographis paniculata]
MPSFPQPGSVTICEINRQLVTADQLSDDQARETYAKVLGTIFSPVSFESDGLLGGETEQDAVPRRNGVFDIFSGALNSLSSGSLGLLLQPADVKLLQDIDLRSVSWHPHKHILAFVSGSHHVTVRDYEDSDGRPPCVLSHEFQKDAKILEWRPNGGRTLSVACKGGICMWAASYPGNVPSVRSGVTSSLPLRGSAARWTLVDFLQTSNSEQISALSWSPDGRYLASASFESSSFTIWDVSQGVGTPFRRGLGGISMLMWSPSGDYFFVAKFDGTFYLWETNTWTSEPWSSKNGFVTGATWDPDGRMILLSFSESSTLGSIHFASKPPSLDAHLIPVELPEIKSLTDSHRIEKIAWDASGERLAVSYRDGDEIYKGLIAIYDVKRTPLISTSLIGFIRGPGDNPKPIAFSFYNKFKQGPLLSVCWSSGFCCTYPLIFR